MDYSTHQKIKFYRIPQPCCCELQTPPHVAGECAPQEFHFSPSHFPCVTRCCTSHLSSQQMVVQFPPHKAEAGFSDLSLCHTLTGQQEVNFFFFLLSGLSHLKKKRTELVFNRRLLRKSSVQCFHVNLPNRLCDQENGQNDHVSHSFIWPSRPVCNRPEYRFNLCRLLNSLKTTDTCPRVHVPTHWWLLLVLGDLAWHLWDHTVLMLT